MRGMACLAIAVLALAGCASDDEPSGPPPPPATTQAGPVAYVVERASLRELERDFDRLVTDGRDVASSRWDPVIGAVLGTYLEDEHGIRVLDGPVDLLRVAKRISDEQQVEVILLGEWHRRRYAKRLARLSPPKGELGDFHAEFTEGELPPAEAESAMRDWLRVFRESLAHARGETVVVIPIDP